MTFFHFFIFKRAKREPKCHWGDGTGFPSAPLSRLPPLISSSPQWNDFGCGGPASSPSVSPTDVRYLSWRKPALPFMKIFFHYPVQTVRPFSLATPTTSCCSSLLLCALSRGEQASLCQAGTIGSGGSREF